MKKSLKRILRGLATVLPLALTLYLIIWLLYAAEALSKPVLLWALPSHLYFPGLGILATLIALIIIGLLVNAYIVRYLIRLGERLVANIPLVKSVLGALKDVIKVFSLANNNNMGSVVTFDIGNNTHLIGFVTGDQMGEKLFGPDSEERVGVYLPMSYQIGGFTVYVPRSRLSTLDIGFEEAMRLTITGGIQSKEE